MTQRLRDKHEGSFFLLVILIGAFLLRSIGLEMKPPHFDEGINGNFVYRMWSDGFYRYDPTNFHGPLYFYVLQLAETIFGFGIFGFRFVTGLISLATVWVIANHRRFVGRAAIWAALIVAVSPGFVFYSRYAIHESLFVFSHVAFSYGYLLYRQERSLKGWGWMVAAVVIAVTTKETFFIFFGTWVIAIFVDRFCTKIFKLKTESHSAESQIATELETPAFADKAAIILIGVLATLALFTGFFMNLAGSRDMITALMVWTKTGTGDTGHEKSFLYWFTLFFRYEWPFFVALVFTPVVYFRSKNREIRWFTLIGFGTWLAYSLIPYKTPWLILNMLWPLSFVFGFLIAGRSRWLESLLPRKLYFARLLVAVALFGTIAHSMNRTMKLNWHDFTDPKEPYVYVQTTMQFENFMDTLENTVKAKPEERAMRLAVLNKDPWPLPWALSRFPKLTWGKAGSMDVTGFDVILVDEADEPLIESTLSCDYLKIPFQIRDAYQSGQAFFRHVDFKGVLPPETQVVEGAAK
ncbi:MAG: flippase activity-associated protein Agl23 [Bdellovibrionota bacterium]